MSLLSTYERIIREAGGPEILADMIICESPEFFGFGEFNAAKRRLIKKKKYKVSMLVKGVEITRLERKVQKSSLKRIARLNSRMWTEDELNYLKSNVSTLDYPTICKHLKRTFPAVYSKVHDLRLSKRKYKRVA